MKQESKIIVVGSVGYGDINQIFNLQETLKLHGFNVLNQFETGYNYSQVKDFRVLKEVSERIAQHDIQHVTQADIIVHYYTGPSTGTAVELVLAKQLGKEIILYSPGNVQSPFPIFLSNSVVYSILELITLLHDLQSTDSSTRKIENKTALQIVTSILGFVQSIPNAVQLHSLIDTLVHFLSKIEQMGLNSMEITQIESREIRGLMYDAGFAEMRNEYLDITGECALLITIAKLTNTLVQIHEIVSRTDHHLNTN